jgi:opacity protein-like surface antigen
MKKFLLGAAAAALTVAAAAPASAQYRYDDRYDRRGGIESDIITGVAVVGGIAAILSAFDRDGGRYGYDNRSRYRDGYSAAVNSCGMQAERYGRGQVRITDVDRKSNDRYEVEGVIEAGYGGGYDPRYDRGYDRGYDPRYDRGYDRRDDRRYTGNGYGERFTCVAYGNGRIRDFRMRDGYASRSRW